MGNEGEMCVQREDVSDWFLFTMAFRYGAVSLTFYLTNI